MPIAFPFLVLENSILQFILIVKVDLYSGCDEQ